jgi:hypothetical protein
MGELPFLSSSSEPPALGIIFKIGDPEISSKPVQFTKVANIVGKGFDEVFFWYPIAPPGYASLGCVVTRTDEAPLLNSFCCPRLDIVNQANIIEVPISRSPSTKASQCWSIWKIENQVKLKAKMTYLFKFLIFMCGMWRSWCFSTNFMSNFVLKISESVVVLILFKPFLVRRKL